MPKQKTSGKTCAVEGCVKFAAARGYCPTHYERARKGLPLDFPIVERRAMPLADRFWKKVNTTGGPDACWDWTASCDLKGYGQISRFDGKRTMAAAHRVSWELHNGLIPDGLHALHRCDNPACVNPAHLFLGTNKDNVDDMVAKRRNNLGQRNGAAKLTNADVALIRAQLAAGVTRREIATAFGVSWRTIRDIDVGEAWAKV